jgi:radical SAM protein with 4Fe4S-binding SPASM domain
MGNQPSAQGKRRLRVLASATPPARLPLAERVRDVDRAWRPVYAVWEVTLRCDLTCRHCSSRAGHARDDELTREQALDVIAQMADLGLGEVTLIGGEVYLRRDWLDLVRTIRERGMSCTMVTGGRNFSLDRAIGAARASLQGISVSVDGLEESHDALRGVPGSFEAALRAIANARMAGIRATANTQIGRQNLHDIPELFERLLGIGIAAWQVQLTVPMGRAADEPQLILEPYQMIEVMPMLARLKSRADAASVLFWPGNNVGYFGPHEEQLRDCLPACHRGSCGAGRVALGIESNGSVKGCPSLPSDQYVGGNVREHSLKDLWERAAPLRFMRDRTVDDLWGRCRDCYYAEECLGGCSWMSHSVTGRPGNNPYCHYRSLTLLRAGLRERIERREPPSGRPFDLGVFDIIEEPWPNEETVRAQAVARGEEVWLATHAS